MRVTRWPRAAAGCRGWPWRRTTRSTARTARRACSTCSAGAASSSSTASSSSRGWKAGPSEAAAAARCTPTRPPTSITSTLATRPSCTCPGRRRRTSSGSRSRWAGLFRWYTTGGRLRRRLRCRGMARHQRVPARRRPDLPHVLRQQSRGRGARQRRSYLDLTALGRQEEWEDSPDGYPRPRRTGGGTSTAATGTPLPDTPPAAWQVYLSGEIHTDWRERIEQGAAARASTSSSPRPVTDHAACDDCGVAILGDRGRAVLDRPPGRRRQRDPHPHPDRAAPTRGRALRRAVQAVERRIRRRLRRRARQAAGHPAPRASTTTRSRRSTAPRWRSPRARAGRQRPGLRGRGRAAGALAHSCSGSSTRRCAVPPALGLEWRVPSNAPVTRHLPDGRRPERHGRDPGADGRAVPRRRTASPRAGRGVRRRASPVHRPPASHAGSGVTLAPGPIAPSLTRVLERVIARARRESTRRCWRRRGARTARK